MLTYSNFCTNFAIEITELLLKPTKTMNKKEYMRPTMRTVELKHKLQMLEGSSGNGVKARRNGYGAANVESWN